MVEVARRVLATTVARLAPPDAALSLIAVAVSGLFADFVSPSLGRARVDRVINVQLQQAGYHVVKVQRN